MKSNTARTAAVKKSKAKAYQSVNPYNGRLLKTFKELTDAQLKVAIQTAASGFDPWRLKSFAQRARVVAKAAAIMSARVDKFARPVTLEMGKRLRRPAAKSCSALTSSTTMQRTAKASSPRKSCGRNQARR